MKYFVFGVIIFCACQTSKINNNQMENNKTQPFDWQGHRGCRGLLPENSIPAFLKALEYPVTTLELDVVMSADSVVIVSHDPWFSSDICNKPDGTAITEKESKGQAIYQLTYDQIKGYDCGSRGNPKFPTQVPMKTFKPSLNDMVNAVEKYCDTKHREKPCYNIEIKSQPEWDGVLTPQPEVFVAQVLQTIDALPIQGRYNIQSFDPRVLKIIRKQRPEIKLALLIENLDNPDTNLKKLGFNPEIYSPYHLLVSKNMVSKLHSKGIQVIPWTINDPEIMKKMIAFGVDGIITDYPDRIPNH